MAGPNGPDVMEGMSGPVCEATASDLSLPGLQEEGKKNMHSSPKPPSLTFYPEPREGGVYLRTPPLLIPHLTHLLLVWEKLVSEFSHPEGFVTESRPGGKFWRRL